MAPAVAPRRPANGSQLRADRTRALVIDETVRCILEEGFAAASAKHITERAGVTWGVVQYHFGDRDGLLMAVVDKGFAELLEALRELPAGAENVRDRTEFIVNAAWEAFSSPTSMAALEILIATRAMRDSGATQHLADLANHVRQAGQAHRRGSGCPARGSDRQPDLGHVARPCRRTAGGPRSAGHPQRPARACRHDHRLRRKRANVMLLRSPDGASARGPGAATGVEATGGVAGSRW